MNEEEQRNEEPAEAAAAEPQELPPSRKRVRTSDPDLQVVCKGGGRDEEERVFECHSLVMATHSGYFDALLSTDMKEAGEKKVIFDDVSPKVFEKAMQFLEDPLAAHDIVAEDALFVASFYNRFEIAVGLKLVTSILGKFLDQWTKTPTKAPLRKEKDLLIQTILFAEESSNDELIRKSLKFLAVKFCQKDIFGMGIFEVEDIKRLHHFLAHEGRECVEAFYNKWAETPDDDETEKLLQDPKFPSIFNCSVLELLSDAFCRKIKLNRIKVNFRGVSMKPTSDTEVASPFVEESSTTIAKETHAYDLYGSYWHFEGYQGSGLTSSFAGMGRVEHYMNSFTSTLQSSSEAHPEKVRDRHMGDWLLHYRFGRKLYKFVFPMSRNQSLPPLGGGWVQVYDDDDDSPHNEEGRLQNPTVELEYIFGDD